MIRPAAAWCALAALVAQQAPSRPRWIELAGVRLGATVEPC